MDEKVEAALARCLARTYRSIDWKSIGVKSAYTFFADRVRAASRMSTVNSFLEELNRMCGVSYTKHSLKDIKALMGVEEEVLSMLRHETQYAVLLALEEADRMKLEKAEGGDDL